MPHRRQRSGSPGKATGVLDIGTSKIVCLIAAVGRETPGDSGPEARVLGVGHQRARGIKAGVITDLDEAEECVRAAVAEAERAAGVLIEEVRVSVACGRIKSRNFAAIADVESGVVTGADMARIAAAGRAYAERDGRPLVHMNEIAVRLDGAPGACDPRGLAAERLAADLHVVTADAAPLRNLLFVVERCYLSASHLVPAPLASALGATTRDERRLGVTCVDIGGGTTKLAMFAEGRFLHAAVAPVGGNHITFDIARALHTPLAEADRIKALYGSLLRARSDEHDSFSCLVAGGERGAVQQTTKAELAEIIGPRVAALADLLGEQIEACEVGAYAGRSIVLTGGASQLVGMADVMAARLKRHVRVGSPQSAPGLPAVMATPAFAAAVGLMSAEAVEKDRAMGAGHGELPASGYLARVGTWLRRGF